MEMIQILLIIELINDVTRSCVASTAKFFASATVATISGVTASHDDQHKCYVSRYSHWNRFIPLFVCGLFDEISDIQRETSAMWINIGEQYGSENREELKDASTYDDLIESYPEATERPTLGCRVLVKKVIFNVLQSNLNDLKDWQIRVRIQGIKLLYQLILHAERHVIILADKMLSALPQVIDFSCNHSKQVLTYLFFNFRLQKMKARMLSLKPKNVLHYSDVFSRRKFTANFL